MPHYRIKPADLHAHYFDVSLSIDKPDATGQTVWLPVWIPGSYLVREFARNIVSISASCKGKPVTLTKLDKHSWQAEPVKGKLEISYRVYAWDLSVRGAYLDETRGFFNGTSTFLAVKGQEQWPCTVELVAPAGVQWHVATSLPVDGARVGEYGLYKAADYDELIDHPVEMGVFSDIRFKACGVPHEVVIAGRHRTDMKRLKRDLKKICEYQIKLFGEPAPFDRYVFMSMVTGDGYGGLEHRASTALMVSRDDLPLEHEVAAKAGYRQYLGLCSHEYFHTWNVKRIKPAAYAPYDLYSENYTRLLWAFEGITSYYDDLTLVRTGLITVQEYFDLLAQTLTGVERGAGRKRQNLEEASLDAWVKYYRQDENSPNAIVSYYTKGALAALCLDLTIRQRSKGKKSLDDVMRTLWQRFGKDFYASKGGKGVGEAEWESIASEVAGFDLKDFFDLALRSTEELPIASLLAQVGVETQLRVTAGGTDKGGWKEITAAGNSIGARVAAEAGGVKLTHVLEGGAAQKAGLAAGDVLVALNGLRITAGNLDTALGSYAAGSEVQIHAFRRDELSVRKLAIQVAGEDTWGLRAAAEPSTAVLAARKAWLEG
ncbi:putative metalloprotease with PDZ domain [Silvimonas terrae]|uniref:Putative metalloprotease with PDZ domain n=1 Tax=Silvimonas terrae TaxID=300266 RepID=A0A840RBW5_9NEIS|nr:PDZ domain-containing protein [Silvimonas terrae]MBB5189926.1 putative metalloprotease with PDZ domain [Silvimonas terrae]